MLKPTFEVEVARARIFNPRRVVVPVLDISNAEMDEVEMFVADEVEM
jgi:hypothetical protein